MIDPKSIDAMGMHESQMIDDNNEIMRVPGGWIYSKVVHSLVTAEVVAMSSVFVPFVQR